MSQQFQELYAKAKAAGLSAGLANRPVPMGVAYQVAGVEQVDIIEDGACGFAWVSFPGNIPFGRWAKQQRLASKHYPSGLCFWIGEHNQSMARKEAHARAMAKVLQEAGIKAYAGSRMD
jgi:hypothetical protein